MFGHLRSNAIAYVAVFLALGGGTAVAVSELRKADQVDGLSAAKFRQRDGVVVAETNVLTLAGMKLRYSCDPNGNKRGTSADVELILQTRDDNAEVTLGITTGSGPVGSAYEADELDLDQGEQFDLDQGKAFAHGSATYSTPGAKVVNLEYGFDEGGSECLAHGVALGG